MRSSMHRRQFVLMASMVLISFILFGGAFSALSFRYTLQESGTHWSATRALLPSSPARRWSGV